MADYYLSADGDNTDGLTWAKAYTTLANALTQITGPGPHNLFVDRDHTDTLSANTTFTFPCPMTIICLDKDTSNVVARMQDGTGYIGRNDTTEYTIGFAGAYRVYCYGLNFQIKGSTSSSYDMAGTDGADHFFDNCRFECNSGSMSIRSNTSDLNAICKFRECGIVFGSSSQYIQTGSATFEFDGCTFSGTAPSTLVVGGTRTGASNIKFYGCDLSLVTGTLVSGTPSTKLTVEFSNCELGSGVSELGSGGSGRAHTDVFIYNCAAGDVHYACEHHNAIGTTEAVITQYLDDGAAFDGTTKFSWLITTDGTNCSDQSPYISPWFGVYNNTVSPTSQTASVEVMRTGSTAAYKDTELWLELSYQGNTGTSQATLLTDRAATLIEAHPSGGGTAQTTSSKTTSNWAGADVTNNWFGKLSPASFTAAVIGYLAARVYCTASGVTALYVDPQIRT